MSAPKDITYRVQSGCHNCEHCFVHEPYDDPIYYFCTHGQPPAPIEPPGFDPWDCTEDSVSDKHKTDVWDWRLALPEVRAAGVCASHKEKKNNLINQCDVVL